MQKLKYAYYTVTAATTVVSFAYCAGVVGKLASDLCAEVGKKYLKTNHQKK